MKTFRTILFFTFLTILACKKEPQNKITYPSSVLHGQNILSLSDGTSLSQSAAYEIGASLEKDANLSIVMTNYPVVDSASGHSTEWFYSDNAGWIISDFINSTQTQKFTSSQTGKISSTILFESYGRTGSCKIDFYENGNSISSTKHFSWH